MTVPDVPAWQKPPPIQKIVAILDKLPASVVETPYGRLPYKLRSAVCASYDDLDNAKELLKAERLKPKAAGLFELLTAAKAIRCKIKAVPRMHREFLKDRMRDAGRKRSAESPHLRLFSSPETAYDVAANAIEWVDFEVLFELLEVGLISLCKEPRPLSIKQVQLVMRKQAVLRILEAFAHADKPTLNKYKLNAVARALAPLFPVEAGLASIKVSTVRDILRTRNQR
jgi:hypothetical protein